MGGPPPRPEEASRLRADSLRRGCLRRFRPEWDSSFSILFRPESAGKTPQSWPAGPSGSWARPCAIEPPGVGGRVHILEQPGGCAVRMEGHPAPKVGGGFDDIAASRRGVEPDAKRAGGGRLTVKDHRRAAR